MKNEILINAINDAGIIDIAYHAKISANTPKRWIENGKMPRSEYSEETNYTDLIIKLAKKNKNKTYTRTQLLPPLEPKKKGKK